MKAYLGKQDGFRQKICFHKKYDLTGWGRPPEDHVRRDRVSRQDQGIMDSFLDYCKEVGNDSSEEEKDNEEQNSYSLDTFFVLVHVGGGVCVCVCVCFV